MLTFPLPSPFDGELLQRSLYDAGVVTELAIEGETLILGAASPDDDDKARPVVEAHAALVAKRQQDRTASDANQKTLEDQAQAALANNRAYLALASPTAAQNTAQIKALTRQNVALIRLVLRRFDAAN